MADKRAVVDIAVPDDFPSVFQGTVAHERAKSLGDVRVFAARGADDEAELIRRIDRARIVINIRAHARFTEGVFASCRKLEMVSIWGTGTDNVDLAAAGRHGVTVTNTPGTNASAVSEHTLALMLALARRVPRLDREMREGQWPRELLTQLLGKTVGVFGTGTIGARVVALTQAIGMEPLAWSLRGQPERVEALGARAASKEEILKEVDVFHDEPLKPGDPLLKSDNVVLSPHNAGQTPEVLRDGLLRAVQNVENFLAGRATDVVVAPVR